MLRVLIALLVLLFAAWVLLGVLWVVKGLFWLAVVGLVVLVAASLVDPSRRRR